MNVESVVLGDSELGDARRQSDNEYIDHGAHPPCIRVKARLGSGLPKVEHSTALRLFEAVIRVPTRVIPVSFSESATLERRGRFRVVGPVPDAISSEIQHCKQCAATVVKI